MTGIAILAVLLVIAVAAPRYGVDTRTNDSWTAGRREPRMPAPAPSPLDDVKMITGRVAARLRRLGAATRR